MLFVSKIVEKSCVGDADVEEFLKDSWVKPSPTAKIIMGYPFLKLISWNWAGFFFNSYWAIYRKEKLGWFFLLGSLLSLLPEHFYPEMDQIGFIPFIVAIVLGAQGDCFILRNALRTFAKKTSLADIKPRSIIGVIVAILLTITYFLIYGFLINKGIIPTQ